MKNLSLTEQTELKETLSHLHVRELKSQLEELNLSSQGFNKNELIERLVHYALTKKELPPLKIPLISRAQTGKAYELSPNTLMLYGSYKNDLATRQFFQTLIGKHFHFTAYGIDWLRERWLEGKPPTYAEFAKEWQDEYSRNKEKKRLPKQEWAYIRFVQGYLERNPHASQKEVNHAWDIKRKECVEIIQNFFKKF